MTTETRRLRIAMAIQHGQHQAELDRLWRAVGDLEAQVAELRRTTEGPTDLRVEFGDDDGGPVLPPSVPEFQLATGGAGRRAFDVLLGGDRETAGGSARR